MQHKLSFPTLSLHVKESYKAWEESYKACEESDKACEESGNACKESNKTLGENTSHPLFGKRFRSFENSLLGYSRSLSQKGKPWRLMPISAFLKANVQRLWFYQNL